MPLARDMDLFTLLAVPSTGLVCDHDSGDGAHNCEDISGDKGSLHDMTYGFMRRRRRFLGGRELSERSGSGIGISDAD